MSARLPNLIIAGVMKGGTTSLFTWLAQHPEFYGSRVKETMFFRPFYQKNLGVDPEALSLDDYRRFFEGAGDQRFVFESTPGYINGGGRLARHLDRSLPDLRVVFVLREPVDRARSYMEWLQGQLFLPKDLSFADYVSICLESEAREGKPDWVYLGLWGGRYADLLREWHDVFGSRMRIVFFEDLKRDARSFTDALCRWLGARGIDEVDINFSVENKSNVPKSRLLHRFALMANARFEPFLRRNRAVKKTLRTVYFRMNGEEKKPRRDDVAALAQRYFAAPNAELRRLLLETQPETRLPDWLRETRIAPADISAMRSGDSGLGSSIA